MGQKIVPVVFATNDNYAPYLGVAIHSLIRHASAEFEYRIYILAAELNRHTKKRLLSMTTDHVRIEIIDPSPMMAGIHIRESALYPPEASYRLLADQIFPQYQKILYLDCDLVVNRDVAELYETDLEGAAAGACLDGLSTPFLSYMGNVLKFPVGKYFNSGVLLIDLFLFSKYEIGKKGLEMLSKKFYQWPDQDVLNLLCLDRVKFLDGRWNARWDFLAVDNWRYLDDRIQKAAPDYAKDPYILHYNTHLKPWAYPEYELADYFWRYARETVFYEEILLNVTKARNKAENPGYRFPWGAVAPGSDIIIYGGGKVGKAYLRQIKESGYCHVLAICDQSPERVSAADVPVISPGEIPKMSFEAVVIAVEKFWVAEEIQEKLSETGIPTEKIVWVDSFGKNEGENV